MSRIGENWKNALRTLTFVFERFGEHELANHAAAGAYAFLLSATPALLLVLGVARAFLSSFPEGMNEILGFATGIFGALDAAGPLREFFSRPLGIGATIFASLSLVWAARLFILTVQRGLRVVWGVSPLEKPVRDNVVTFALEFAALVLVVLVLGAAEALRFFLHYLVPIVGGTVASISRILLGAIPPLLLYLYAFLTYRFIPPRNPATRVAAFSALLCVLLYMAFSATLAFLIDRTHYDLLYGVLGGLVIVLLKVWTFFMVYFHCAELAFIIERFDSLLFARFLRVSQGGKQGRLARSLFARPERLVRKYGRIYPAGRVIFREGEAGREAFYLLSGSVGVYLGVEGAEKRIATIDQGELFGEMAGLMKEGRTATTKADGEIEVITMPPGVFENLLATDWRIARRMIDLLSERLKRADFRVGAEGSAKSAKGEGVIEG
jgi:membrane protein